MRERSLGRCPDAGGELGRGGAKREERWTLRQFSQMSKVELSYGDGFDATEGAPTMREMSGPLYVSVVPGGSVVRARDVVV